jgi:hypothetical protein
MWVGDDQHVAAITTIAAVWAAFGHVLLPPKAYAAVAAAASGDRDDRLINERTVLPHPQACGSLLLFRLTEGGWYNAPAGG